MLLVSVELLKAFLVLVLGVSTILLLEQHLLLFHSVAVRGLLHHESVPSLESFGPDVLGRLREQLTELVEPLLRDAHEEGVG